MYMSKGIKFQPPGLCWVVKGPKFHTLAGISSQSFTPFFFSKLSPYRTVLFVGTFSGRKQVELHTNTSGHYITSPNNAL